MSIRVLIRNVYGKEAIYPACETADTFCLLLRTRTLTRDAIRYIKALGYTVHVTQTTPETL
jgi:hypothetical protein